MADKQCSERDRNHGARHLESQIASIVSRRLSGVSKRLTEEQILKILRNRRKKWRKREGRDPELDCGGIIPQLDKEKADQSDIHEEFHDALVAKRREGIQRARQMERDKTLHSLHVLIDRSKRLKHELSRYNGSIAISDTAFHSHPPPHGHTEAQEKLLQDLEKVVNQAQEFKKLTMMKFHMTPRPPAINRTNLIDSRMPNGFSTLNNSALFTPDHHHLSSDNNLGSGHHIVTSSEKLNDYLLEVQLPTIAQTIEATSEELNFAAEMQKVTTEQRHTCDGDDCDAQQRVLEGPLSEAEEPELLKLVSAVKNIPKGLTRH